MGSEAAPEIGLLRSPSGINPLATGAVFCIGWFGVKKRIGVRQKKALRRSLAAGLDIT
ncbi:hypothetical protein ACQR3P_21415 [Rhodococcus sp. IEGM1300]